MLSKLLAATATAVLLLAGTATPALAATPQVRVTIDADDVLGKAVAGVPVTITSSIDEESVTTDQWGHARVRLDIVRGDTVVVTSSQATGAEFANVSAGDRLQATLTVDTVAGYEKVWAQSDLNGDGVDAYDTVWHQARAGLNDRWVIQFTSGEVRKLSFGGEVVDIFATNLTDDPANELAVIERLASGEHRLWVYSELADDLDRIALGVLPVLTFDQSDFDGDGLQDLLFVDNGVDDGYDATLLLSSTQRVQSFELGSQFAYVFGEYLDVTGDGIDDIVAAETIPDTTLRWSVWESETRSVTSVDVGTLGSFAAGDNFADGDGDGMRELISRYPLKLGFSRWEVYEYASGDYFSVVLDDAEFDRGPLPGHYPPEWFE